jgi:hypothetical protein
LLSVPSHANGMSLMAMLCAMVCCLELSAVPVQM